MTLPAKIAWTVITVVTAGFASGSLFTEDDKLGGTLAILCAVSLVVGVILGYIWFPIP